MAEPITPNIGKVYFLKSGLQRDHSNLDSFHPASTGDINKIHIFLEDGVSSNLVEMNYKRVGSGFPTSEQFPMRYVKAISHMVSGENFYRTFAMYEGFIPSPVSMWNANGRAPMSLEATITQLSGESLLGNYEDYSSLINAPEAQELEGLYTSGVVAYIYESSTYNSVAYNDGFYMVFDNGNDYFTWERIEIPITHIEGVSQKQYNVTGITLQKGNVPTTLQRISLSQEYISFIMRYLASVQKIGNDAQLDIDDHKLDVDNPHLTTAIKTPYVNIVSGLVSQNVQGAIDELDSILDEHKDDLDNPHQTTATKVPYVNSFSGLIDTTVQGAVDELKDISDNHIGNKNNPHEVKATQIEYEVGQTVKQKIDLKADITYVDSQDNLKADITYVDSENQQQKTYIDNADNLKADITYVDSQDNLKEDLTNKAVNFVTIDNVKYPTTKAVDDFLKGYVNDISYNSSNHIITFSRHNEPNVILDLPIESLTKNITFDGESLLIQNENGTITTVPITALVQGMVKSVNGKTANPRGEVVIEISDISGLNDLIDTKVDKVLNKSLVLDSEIIKLESVEENANNTTVIDSLISSDSTFALSANQGKELKDLLDSSYIDIDDFPYIVEVAKNLASVGRFEQLRTAWENQSNFVINAIGQITDYNEPNPHVKDIVIPKSVKMIPDKTFETRFFKKDDYTTLTMFSGIETIGSNAFVGWEFYESHIVIPNSVTKIGGFAFSSWTSTKDYVVIPKNVTSIGQLAFSDLLKSKFFIMEGHNPPVIEADTFNNLGNKSIYVPNDRVNSYKVSSTWSSYVNNIKPISEYYNRITDEEKNKLELVIDTGDGTKFLSNDGTYKVIETGLDVDNEIFEVVSVLPTTGVANKIYLVPSSDPETQNVLDEFIWVDNAWEKIGSVSVDLSNYFNKTEINSMLDDKVDKNANITGATKTKITYDSKGLVTAGADLVEADIPALSASKITQTASSRFVTDTEKTTWNNKVDKVTGKGLSTEDYTSDEKTKLTGIQEGAQVNAVTTVAGRTGAVVLAKADVGLGSLQNYAIASKTQAESGTSNVLYMTPLRTKELITVVMGDIESALDAILGV